MRVIAGRLRGRALRSAPGKSTRPTTQRARTGLFDWIGPDVLDASVLDLFAGGGAIGIEALSRGAKSATFVERNLRACRVLRRNLEELELVGVSRVLELDVERALRRLGREQAGFDLVFADPPYGEQWVSRLLVPDSAPAALAPTGAILMERDPLDPALDPGPGLSLRGSKTYGRTRFDRYEKVAEA